MRAANRQEPRQHAFVYKAEACPSHKTPTSSCPRPRDPGTPTNARLMALYGKSLLSGYWFLQRKQLPCPATWVPTGSSKNIRLSELVNSKSIRPGPFPFRLMTFVENDAERESGRAGAEACDPGSQCPLLPQATTGVKWGRAALGCGVLAVTCAYWKVTF